MKNLLRYGVLSFSIILAIIGAEKIINCVDHGTTAANDHLIQMGGSMAAEEH
jgi:hypothetical protein